MSSFSQLRDRERQEEEDADDFDPSNPFFIAPPQRIRPEPLNKPPALPVPYLAPLPHVNPSRYAAPPTAPPTNINDDDLYDQNNPFAAPNPFGPPPARPIYAVPFTKL